MRASIRFRRKLTLLHETTGEIAVAELKVIEVPESGHYPEGLKYSMFLASTESGKVLVGFDNHKPKGPHLHRGEKEMPYDFRGVDQLVEDFWDMAREEGFFI